jgi:hypothetical protein
MTHKRWVRDARALYDFIGYVVVYAPDGFPVEDYLQPHEQMTLDLAFDELRHGIGLLQLPAPRAQALANPLKDALHEVTLAYFAQGVPFATEAAALLRGA